MVLNDLSEMEKRTEGELNIGTVMNDGSEVNLLQGEGRGFLANSQSAQKVQLPQIKSLNPLTIPGAFSSSNLKKSKWTKDNNTMS